MDNIQLEFDPSRQTARHLFTELLNMSEIGRASLLTKVSPEKANKRRELILSVAEQLLGPDFDYVELT